jgi:GcrA cell cycle regulator
MDWTPAVVDRLKREYAAGSTPRIIADHLGTTRNAVIGKIHRLGLAHTKAPVCMPSLPRFPFMARVNRKAKTLEPRAVIAKPAPSDAPAPLPARPVSFAALKDRHCRWIFGPDLYCGVVCDAGSSWCLVHHMIVRRLLKPA